MNNPLPPIDHRDVWELLPWHVNGRLGESDRRRVEAHLQVCDSCRNECAAQRELHQIIAADTGVEQMPMAGLNKLRRRIATIEATGAMDPAPESAHPAGRRRPRAAALTAAAAGLAALLIIPAALHWQNQRASAYYTVTSAAVPQGGAVIRAVFAPTLTVSELHQLLDDAQLKIVSGPTEAGVYSLAQSGPHPVEWSLRTLRGHDTVRFAESLAPVAPPP